MRIVLESEESIRLIATADVPLTIEAPSADQSYSPFHMLASSLAVCTFSVLASWAENARISPADLEITVSWTFADKPHRVGEMSMRFTWPSLPAERHAAAERVAKLCTVHATLQHPPTISIALAPRG